MFIHVNGIDLFYTRSGCGRPLIMVHGNGEDHTIFDEAVEILREHFTVYAVDSRDHGESTKVSELHYQNMADDICAMLEALDLDDVVFYGFSDGGIIGLLLAMETDRVSKMIISGANTKTFTLRWNFIFKALDEYIKYREPKVKLMLVEPNIPDSALKKISIPVHVLAGENDLIRESHTRHIAAQLPNSTLQILAGEGHGTYIVHNPKIAEIILDIMK